jgi:putative lipoic acid-binding regulatory protein
VTGMANFKKLINFPSKVDFRVIVLDVPDIENTVISFFAERFDLKVETPIAKKPSKNGTYYSLSVNVTVKDEKQMNEIYTELAKVKDVKYVL